MSGAGKSQTANALEDMGFYCVDNVPPQIIPAFVDMAQSGNVTLRKMALVTDVRGGDMFDSINEILAELAHRKIDYKILFLDAADEILVRRYKENRRKHPLSQDGAVSIAAAVKNERKKLEGIRLKSNYIIDTSHISIAQLKEKLTGIFYGNDKNVLKIRCMSFGFKYGLDSEADLVFDVRCLPNPYYIEELKDKTGLDKSVRDYVMESNDSKVFLEKLLSFVDFSVPLYEKEGKSQLTIAIGCTGGKHRSVTFAELVGEHLKNKNYDCTIIHRDILKR
jgi:UPF0042 nucleotide-binding protein